MNLLAAIAVVFFCGFLATDITRRWLAPGPGGRVALALAWFVLLAAFFFGTFFLLGFVNLVTGWPALRPSLAAALDGLLALVALVTGRRGAARAGAAVAARSGFREEARDAWGGLDGAGRILTVAVAATFIASAAMLCAGFPRGYEPRAYHLPIAVHAFQTHGLRVWDREHMDTFPANGSLYYGYLMGLLPEHLVSASNVLFLAPLLFSLYALGRWTGSDSSASLVAACGAATIPIAAFSSLETGADVAGIAFLGAAAYFALAGDPLATPDVLLAGLAAGLAFGFKSLHLVSVAFLLGVIAIRRWRAASPSPIRRASGVAALGACLFLAAVLAMSSVWLLRNWMEFRNPIYPVHVGRVSDAFGWAKAPGVDYLERGAFQFEWVRSPAEWFVYPWIEWHSHGENFKHSSGLGAFFAATVPPALVVSLLGLGSRKPREREALAFLLAGCGLLFAVWWALGDRQPRYLMGGLVYAIPLVAWMIGQSTGRARRAFAWVACVTAIFMLGVVLSKQGFEFAYRFLSLRQWSRHEFYGYPAAVDGLPAGSTVVNLVTPPDNWALFGTKHDNRVINQRWALRALGAPPTETPPESVSLDGAALRRLGATHILALSRTRLQLGPGVALTEVGRSEGPVTLPVLYRVDYREAWQRIGEASTPATSALRTPVNP
jgi:hypothetical protein